MGQASKESAHWSREQTGEFITWHSLLRLKRNPIGVWLLNWSACSVRDK